MTTTTSSTATDPQIARPRRGRRVLRLVQREIFTGVLVPFFAHGLDTDTQRGFEEMNQALKVRAEQIG